MRAIEAVKSVMKKTIKNAAMKTVRNAAKASALFCAPVSELLGTSILLVACHVPAVTDSGNVKMPSVTKDGTVISLVHHESYALCPDGSLESGLNLFDDAKSWQSFLKASSQRAPQLVEWKPNFANTRVLVFRLGSKTSAGYGVRAVEARLQAKTAELSLYVNSTRPQPGNFTASVITAPCLIAQISASDFASVSVIDASDGTVLGKIRQ
jgi:hypothetical protein